MSYQELVVLRTALMRQFTRRATFTLFLSGELAGKSHLFSSDHTNDRGE